MRRLLALFVALVLVGTPAFSQKKDTYRVRTVVIDPGHGGAKPGAQGAHSQEKAITLAVALKVGRLIADNYPDVKVIYTRTSDVDISLAERAHIANRNKADLFVSIHANSHPTSSPTGVETFVMGLSESRANLEVARKENADILLEADYKDNEAYRGFDPNSPESFVMLAMFQNDFIDKSLNFAQAIQNQYKQNLKTINRGVKQAELFVLYKTTCPSVLTEVGFISNPHEEAFMMSEEGQAKIALCIFNAFMNYKATEEGTEKIANPKINIKGYTSPEAPTAKETPETVLAPVAPVASEVPTAPESPVVAATPAKRDTIVIAAAQAPAERPVPRQELTPRMEIADEPEPDPVVEEPPVAKPAVEPLRPPVNTAKPNADKYFTVQFLTSSERIPEDSPAFTGIDGVETYFNGKYYCYSVGRFATFQQASDYSREVQRATIFKDAWAVIRKAESMVAEAGAPSTLPETRQAEPSQETPAEASLPTPANSATAKTMEFFTVQFLTSTTEIPAGDPAFHGLRNVIVSRNGKLYCYSVGRFRTFAEANDFCKEVQRQTPFKDAWAVRRVMPVDGDSKDKAGQETKVQPKESKAQPKETKTQPREPKATEKGTYYRVQFSTSTRILQNGDPDLHGIRDFRYSKSGNVYVYTAGNYTKLSEAKARCAEIKRSTPFKDAFVVGYKNGKRITIE